MNRNPFLFLPTKVVANSIINILCFFFLTTSLLAQGIPWTTKTNMPTARYGLSSSVVSEKIYVMGGEATGGGAGAPSSPKVEEYDPSTDTWDTKTDMPTGRQSFSSSAVNGKIYVFGGQTEAVFTNIASVEEYDPQTNTWDTTKTPMPDVRAGLSTSAVNGKIYAIGGWNWSGSNDIYYGDVWEYDPITNTWDDTTRMDMPTPRAYLSTCVIDEKIYAFGGRDVVTAFRTLEVYDPVSDSWESKTDMPEGRIYLKTSSVDSFIYIFGGSTGAFDPPMSNAWEYNPTSDSYKIVSPMPMGLIQMATNTVSDKIYIIGGSTTPWQFSPTDTVFEYDPEKDPLSSLTFIERDDQNMPKAFSLLQNYPNPFNPSTTIEFSIPKAEFVTLKIYNLLGQEVKTLVSDNLISGNYKYNWNAGSLAGGVYIYKLQTNNFIQVRKMVYLK